MPMKYYEWEIAFRTGWTLDYIRSLSMQDLQDYFQVIDGRSKAGLH